MTTTHGTGKTHRRRVPAKADNIRVRRCTCGCDLALVELYGARGNVFATAWLTRQQMLGMADAMADLAASRPMQRRMVVMTFTNGRARAAAR